MARRVRFGVIGSTTVEVDGETIQLSSPSQRRLLLRLVVDVGQPVATDALAEAIWGEDLPENPVNAVRYHVWRLRSELGDADVISTVSGGYSLVCDPESIDSEVFDRLIEAARSAVAPEVGLALLDEALCQWRSTPFADSRDAEFAQAEIRRLEEQRHSARQLRARFLVASGETSKAIPEIEGLLQEHPYDEGLWSALMQAMYAEGRQTDALRAYQRARTHLGDEIGIEPTPELRAIEQQVLEQDDRLDSRPRAPTNLPQALTTFIGRTEEIEAVLESAAERRLTTIVGAGGAGKTRLAIECGRRLGDHHADGVWIVDMSRRRSGDDVDEAIGEALGLLLSDDEVVPRTEVLAHLRNRRCLLIVDNCEHMIDEIADAIVAILEHCPHVVVVATSRAALRARGEVVYAIPELKQPPEGSGWDVIVDSSASALFVDRARDAGFDLEENEEEAAAIASLCRLVAGLPLAIELVAARLSTLSLAELVSEIRDGLEGYGELRGTSERHQTMESTVRWSFELLDDSAQDLLAGLSVFVGGFTLDAALYISGSAAGGTETVSRDLQELVECSMVDRRRSDGRYILLDPIRLFARDRLVEAGRIDAVRAAHARAFHTIVVSATRDLARSDRPAVYDGLDAEAANIRATLEWFAETGDWRDVCSLTSALAWYWHDRRRFEESRLWAEFCRPHLDEADAWESAAIACLLALETVRPAHERAAFANEALDAARASSDERLYADVALALLDDADVAGLNRLSDDDVKELLDEVESIYERLGDAWGQIDILNERCAPRFWEGRAPVGDALQIPERARLMARTSGYHRGLCRATNNAIQLRMAMHPDGGYDDREVERLFVDAVAAAQKSGDPIMEWEVNAQWGWHLERTGRSSEAVAVFEECASIAEAHGMLFGSVMSHTSLALALEDVDLSRALSEVHTALVHAVERQVDDQTVWVVEIAARLLVGAGESDLAAQSIGTAEYQRRVTGNEMPHWDAPFYAATIERIERATGSSYDSLRREGAETSLSGTVALLLGATATDRD